MNFYNLTRGAIYGLSKSIYRITPVVQVIDTHISMTRNFYCEGAEKYKYKLILSDGVYFHAAYIPDELMTSNRLVTGSIVKLTEYSRSMSLDNPTVIEIIDLNVICIQSDIIGYPKPFPYNKTSPTEKYTDPIKYQDVDPDHNEYVYHCHSEQEHPASRQIPPTSTKKCSSCSQTKREELKRQPSNIKEDDIMTSANDTTKDASMTMEKKKDDEIGACFEKLEKLGWGTENPLYDTALFLFVESAEYRKLWLLLKPESCGKWVNNAGKKFELFNYFTGKV